MMEAAYTWPWCCPFQSVIKKNKVFFDEKDGKVKR